MGLARILRLVPAIVIALATLVALPLAEVPTTRVTRTCCCPDNAVCHCPGHDVPGDRHDAIRSCGRTFAITLAPALAAVVAPVIGVAAPRTVERPHPVLALAIPHPTQWLPAPAAPS